MVLREVRTPYCTQINNTCEGFTFTLCFCLVLSVVHAYFLLSQVKSCVTAFHVTCGFKHNLEMKTILDDEATDGVRHIVSLRRSLHCVYLTNVEFSSEYQNV